MEKLRLRRSARKDSMRIEELVLDYYLKLVPIKKGFKKEEETVCKKIAMNQLAPLTLLIISMVTQRLVIVYQKNIGIKV